MIHTRRLGKAFRIGMGFKDIGHTKEQSLDWRGSYMSEIGSLRDYPALSLKSSVTATPFQRKANAMHLDQAFILTTLFVSEVPVRDWSPDCSALFCSKAYRQELMRMIELLL